MTTVKDLTRALEQSWGADTAYDATDWSESNRARGQCVVSSLVVQDYLGGELMRYAVEAESLTETHYVNILPDGEILDTTASQYAAMPNVILTVRPITLDGYASAREKRLADEDTHRRYELLKARVDALLVGDFFVSSF